MQYFINMKLAELNISSYRAIKQAHIQLNGITVVSGVNGCGKSTMAKLIYYIFHHANSYERLALNDYLHKIRPYIEAISQILSIVDGPNHRYSSYRYRRIIFGDLETIEDVESEIKSARLELSNNLQNIQDMEEKNPTVYSRMMMILKSTLNLSSDDSRSYKELVNVLYGRMDSQRQNLHNDIVKRPYRLLKDQLANEFDDNVASNVSLKEYDVPIFGKNVSEVPIPHYIKRVALLDTPMIIGMPIHFEQPSYWQEINQLARIKPKRGYKLSINKKIKDEIIHGETSYADGMLNHGFVFKDDDGNSYDLLDCATGIKTFSLLQILLKNRFLEEDTMMVLDEPETNLHPEWIMELANLIVMIHEKIGTKFFITSHSPQMVSGLRYISETRKCIDDVSFYVAKENEKKRGSFVYSNLDNDIDPIFESFNKSYKKQDEYTK